MAHLEVFTYRRGAFSVARFDRMGNSQEPLIVKRAIATELHVFFFVYTVGDSNRCKTIIVT